MWFVDSFWLNIQCISLFFSPSHPLSFTTLTPINTSPLVFSKKVINNINISCSTITDSHFGLYATDYNFTNNESLVWPHLHPTPVGHDLPDSQMNSLDYNPAHAFPGCQGYFEWEGEVKTAKRSCWGCGAKDEYRYRVEPIVGGTNAGCYMECASTLELANLGHLVYQLNNKVVFFEHWCQSVIFVTNFLLYSTNSTTSISPSNLSLDYHSQP